MRYPTQAPRLELADYSFSELLDELKRRAEHMTLAMTPEEFADRCAVIYHKMLED